MNRRDVAALAFVICGLYSLLQAIGQLTTLDMVLGSVLAGQVDMDGRWLAAAIAVSIPVPALFVVMGILLIRRRWQLADWLFPGEAEPFIPKANAREIHAIAFCVLGVFVVLSTLPEFGRVLALYLEASSPVSSMRAPDLWRVWPTVIPLILGLALIFGADTWVGLWKTVRFGGTEGTRDRETEGQKDGEDRITG